MTDTWQCGNCHSLNLQEASRCDTCGRPRSQSPSGATLSTSPSEPTAPQTDSRQFCTRCGTPAATDAVFCGKCGQPLDGRSALPSTAPTTVVWKDTSGRGPMIAAGVLIIAAVVVGGLMVSGYIGGQAARPTPTSAPTPPPAIVGILTPVPTIEPTLTEAPTPMPTAAPTPTLLATVGDTLVFSSSSSDCVMTVTVYAVVAWKPTNQFEVPDAGNRFLTADVKMSGVSGT